MKLLTEQKSSPKMLKSGDDFVSAILYLSPSTISGRNLCPSASPGCIAACLNTSGRGVMRPVQAGRLRRTRLFLDDRAQFFKDLDADIARLVKRGKKLNKRVVIRLNGTSDLNWFSVIEKYPNIQFYDYTKSVQMIKSLKEKQAEGRLLNYHLTFSLSEVNQIQAKMVLRMNASVAVVFADKTLPQAFMDRPVVNGDSTDYRFKDPNGVIVGLYAKGKAKKDTSGFVVRMGVQNGQTLRSIS